MESFQKLSVNEMRATVGGRKGHFTWGKFWKAFWKNEGEYWNGFKHGLLD